MNLNKWVFFIVVFIHGLIGYSQNNYFINFWQKSDAYLSISHSNWKSFPDTYLPSSVASLVYTEKCKVYFGVLQNYSDYGTSKFIIQNKSTLVIFNTSPSLKNAQNPRVVLDNLYDCLIIDISNYKFISFVIVDENREANVECGIKHGETCSFGIIKYKINITREELIKVDEIKIFEDLLNIIFKQKINMNEHSCDVGLWNAYSDILK